MENLHQTGLGNGWKGWYKGKFFRSLRELCFMIDNPSAISAERLSIKYIDILGKDRTCRPDFILDNKIIEIKPIRLINTPNNKLKFEAITKYCEDNNLNFVILDQEISKDKIINHIHEIEFIGNYKERFDNYVSK